MCISCLTNNHFHASSKVEQLGEVLSTGGQIHSGAVDKGRPSVLQGTPFSYYAIRCFGPRMCIGRRFADLEIETLVTKVS
jgi:hypothetical protein